MSWITSIVGAGFGLSNQATGFFVMHCAAWWLALASLFAPPLENHYDVR